MIEIALYVLALAVSAALFIFVMVMFIWAARKDGEKDRELQRRLGIKRRTRIGR